MTICSIFIRAGLGDVFREWNQLERAHKLLRDVLDYVSCHGTNSMEWLYLPDLYLILVRYCLLIGNDEKAAEFIQAAGALVINYYAMPDALDQVVAMQVRFWLVKNSLPDATAWAEKVQQTLQEQKENVSLRIKIALARVWLANEKLDQAAELLTEIVGGPQTEDALECRIETWLLLALAKNRLGQKAGAQSALLSALELARPGGYVRIFIDEGPLLKAMLSGSLEEIQRTWPGLAGYANHLLANFGAAPKIKAEASLQQELFVLSIDSLSERELEVLKLMADGKSPKQMSQHLTVSINTVHTHIKNIYKKLEVHTREKAVEKAIAFHLI